MAASSTTFPLTGPIALQVRLGHGSLTVAARDDLTEASVRLTPRDANSGVLDRISVGMEGSTVRVTGPRQGGLADLVGGWRRDRDGVDVAVDVPTDTTLTVTTS